MKLIWFLLVLAMLSFFTGSGTITNEEFKCKFSLFSSIAEAKEDVTVKTRVKRANGGNCCQVQNRCGPGARCVFCVYCVQLCENGDCSRSDGLQYQ